MKFYKLQALGNDFVVVFEDLNYEQILKICDYKIGIGCDQLFIVSQGNQVKIYNRDGSEVSFCGNGLRALAYLQSKLLNKNYFDFYVFGACYSLQVLENSMVELKINEQPIFLSCPGRLSMLLNGLTDVIAFDSVDVGNKNLVVFMNKENGNYMGIKNQIHDLGVFMDDVNMSFNMILPNGDIKSYVIERGAGITLSCGSSAIATVASAVKNGFVHSDNINVIHPGGVLSHSITHDYQITQTGEANLVFDGEYYL